MAKKFCLFMWLIWRSAFATASEGGERTVADLCCLGFVGREARPGGRAQARVPIALPGRAAPDPWTTLAEVKPESPWAKRCRVRSMLPSLNVEWVIRAENRITQWGGMEQQQTTVNRG